MPSPTLASAHLMHEGRGFCPECMKHRVLYSIVVAVTKGEEVKRTKQVKACAQCLGEGDMAAAVGLKADDVVDLRTKNQRRKTNKRARKRESICAEEIGGHTTPGSGSGVAKGDARNDCWMIDDKHTKFRQFSLREIDVKKMIGEAVRSGRSGALKVGFRNGEGCEVAVVHWPDFLELIDGKGD